MPHHQSLSRRKFLSVGAKKESSPTLIKKLAVPDILPEDLGKKRAFTIFDRPSPRRRSQLLREEMKVDV